MGLKDLLFGSYSKKELKRIDPIAQQVYALEDEYRKKTDEELRQTTVSLREKLAGGATLDDILPDAFAACREAGDRVLGMRHFPVQVVGGIVLHQGRIAEMKTGEGKTLVATLPAYLNALSGKGVHIVTVNDYLAKRDSEWMGKIYRFLGLSVGLIVNGMDNEARRRAYNCDITYGTNNELGFDYLRDNMVIYKENKVQRGFNFAIVDEVDSILIDEARTPLIISGQGDKSTDLYQTADKFARTLKVTKVTELNAKEDNDELEGDYIVDEKAKTATLTKAGIKKAEAYFGLTNLNDADNMTIAHHINQAIRAHGIMVRDVDYVVKDGEVIIVDEFTGRLMIGRRFNEGLHQAIEAKEGVKVMRESKTLATITFQNFFRLYQKLSGMTGTAMTEQNEFNEIYKLDVIEIPTNKPNVRKDHDDQVYKTEQAKFNAVIDQVVESHAKGQPVLVGTISIEKSELLSKMLKHRGVPHQVLNAKYHEKEAQIVAQAGKKGAVTIATNMAGRGTDIILGGNAEMMAKDEMRKKGYYEELLVEATGYSDTDDEEIIECRKTFAELEQKYKEQIAAEAEEVKAAGGLFIIGTERHESRRIDNQLRGRAGRQGDPGETIFYMSLEDDLMRLFGGERVQALMNSLGLEEDQPIETKMLTNAIESAQRKVEGRNFGIRKNVLQYDDVMNKQREIIYAQRDKVLNGEDLKQYVLTMLEEGIKDVVSTYLAADSDPADWNLKGLKDHYLGWITGEDDLDYTPEELAGLTPDDIAAQLIEKAKNIYFEKEEKYGSPIMRELERVVLLRVVDTKWMDHIDAMDELKKGIYLRSYAQKDPVVEYKIEGFDMFDAMVESIKEDTVKMLLTVQIKTQEEPKREAVMKPATNQSGDGSAAKEPVRKKKVGRNDPCPCGSGKKYKKCCGRFEN
ncbi:MULTISPECIES: preprotein translocase subunit SecA [Eubacteriales]|uniref:Protein translocase subunit SecA n=1 Tax=Bittarella massiliensis (ex Durand et al. 2017) TaxID=1720313 RepID=A0AAQ1MEJ9_9FIRM|nr:MULTISPECIES: preprotein translocase subunit SecA [Eubacteriales]ERI97383.1 preprotein translocase, SecA subunit [Clostridium sp. ATCC 29733]MZL70529.1 preprotein translocase subunit SecA [Bittarella massiliensis (ex Durand et al. 2017)]MZL80247.1 preprotein translocase subunit SecA [Bittarella massiliensis (ex Durand et al. 2017)]SHG35807.1 preprotein translocase subunit SecA [Bittarella massiliensis (ex Durand et al. 2017)]